MKKGIILGLPLFALLVMTGCTRDIPGPEPGPDGSGKTITFNFPASQKEAVTYADPTAKPEEMELSHLDIYMFDNAAGDGSGTLELVYRQGDNSLKLENNTATIDVTERTGAKVFYFVGNAQNVSSVLGSVRYGETTIDEFKQLLSDVKTELPATPLLMTASKEIANVENVTDPAEKQVKLYRRVARFDIDNDAAATNFTIQKILLTDINQQVYLFGDAAHDPSVTLVSGNAAEIDLGDGTGYNDGPTESVFYTYPTTLGAGKTIISLEGEFRKQTRLYTIDLSSDFEIEPNTRYILKAKPVSIDELVFEIIVVEWSEGEPAEAKPNNHGVEMVNLRTAEGPAVLTGTTFDVSDATDASKISFTAKSFQKDGTRVEFTYLTGKESNLQLTKNVPESMISYAIHYEQNYEISVPAQTIMAPVEILVELVSVADPREREAFKIVSVPNYPGTAQLKPVLVGGVWWAPVNVGAETTSTADFTKNVGTYHQWGRNYGSLFNVTNDAMPGPFTPEQANDNPNVFITGNTGEGGWLTIRDYTLWQGDNRQGPCPPGWRVPTVEDCKSLIDRYSLNGSISSDGKQLIIKGDVDTETLLLPFTGHRSFVDNKTYLSTTTSANYWTSEVIHDETRIDDGTLAYSLTLSKSNPVLHNAYGTRAHARPVRCVADE